MTKKKSLDPCLKAECDALKAIYLAKKNKLKLSLAKIGAAAQPKTISPTAVKHYIDGANQLNAKIAMLFADQLQVEIRDFSPRLADEIASFAQHSNVTGKAAGIFDRVTPRSRAVMNRIIDLEAKGKLTDDDLLILEKIIERFSS